MNKNILYFINSLTWHQYPKSYFDSKIQRSYLSDLIIQNNTVLKDKYGRPGRKVTQKDLLNLIKDFNGVILKPVEIKILKRVTLRGTNVS